MKMNKLILTAVLAFAGLAAVETAASAQIFNVGDLLLNFRINDGVGQGAGVNIEVDLGVASSFNYASVNSSIQSVASDLSTTYGASWATRFDLVYSLVAADSSNNIFVSNPDNSNTVTATSPKANGANASSVRNLYSEAGGTVGSSANVHIITFAGDPSSYSDVIANVNSDRNAGNPYANDYNFVLFSTEQTVTDSSGVAIYRQLSSIQSANLGTFVVNSSGTLGFTPAGVPEPSTYALIALGAGVMLLMRRRSFNS